MVNSLGSLTTSRTTAPPVSVAGVEQRSKVRWRDVALFTGLAYAFARVLWMVLLPNFFDLLTASRTPNKAHGRADLPCSGCWPRQPPPS
jgi:hypothetical protein